MEVKEAFKGGEALKRAEKRFSDLFGNMNFVVCGKIEQIWKVCPVLNGWRTLEKNNGVEVSKDGTC